MVIVRILLKGCRSKLKSALKNNGMSTVRIERGVGGDRAFTPIVRGGLPRTKGCYPQVYGRVASGREGLALTPRGSKKEPLPGTRA
ncbi:hypothetical protein J6590_063910 [Homalodisca vitripennis]|nr:hypothetical protein J6590_063910 [Homalodisca vitripennis]